MSDQDRCTICRRRPRIADSVLCAICGYLTIEASLTHRKQQANLGQVTRIGVSLPEAVTPTFPRSEAGHRPHPGAFSRKGVHGPA